MVGVWHVGTGAGFVGRGGMRYLGVRYNMMRGIGRLVLGMLAGPGMLVWVWSTVCCVRCLACRSKICQNKFETFSVKFFCHLQNVFVNLSQLIHINNTAQLSL